MEASPRLRDGGEQPDHCEHDGEENTDAAEATMDGGSPGRDKNRLSQKHKQDRCSDGCVRHPQRREWERHRAMAGETSAGANDTAVNAITMPATLTENHRSTARRFELHKLSDTATGCSSMRSV